MYRIYIPTVFAILFIILAPALALLVTGDFRGADSFYGLEEDHQMVNLIFSLCGE